jgi:hypothetical protein
MSLVVRFMPLFKECNDCSHSQRIVPEDSTDVDPYSCFGCFWQKNFKNVRGKAR